MLRANRTSLLALVLASLVSVATGQQSVSGPGRQENGAAPSIQQWNTPSWSRPIAEGDQRSSPEIATAVAPTSYLFVPITPCRQYNSLNFSPLAQGVNRVVTLTGAPCNIPAAAVAVSANITVFNITGATGNGVFKVDTISPPASAWINYPPTEIQRANAGILALNGAGQIIVQVAQGAGQVDFVVDVNGYYVAPVLSDLAFSVLVNCASVNLGAFVLADGTLVRGLNATSSARLLDGVYMVTFNQDITACVWTGNAGLGTFSGTTPPGFVSIVGRAGTTTALFVQTFR